MKVRWLSAAQRGLRDAIDDVAERNFDAAVGLSETIKASTARLAATPNIGRPGRIQGTRELVIGRTPYLVAYRVSEDTVTIVRFLHGARRWPKRL